MKSYMNYGKREIRFPKNVDSKSIACTAADIVNFYSNKANHDRNIRIEDKTGFALGINMLKFDKHTGNFKYGRLKSGSFSTYSRCRDVNVLLAAAANELAFDDDEKQLISWDD